MIVNKEKKVIYLHNPKCGGTFLRDVYIETYGEGEATKWWDNYTSALNTDTAHITRQLLPRFIPDWADYRIVMMIRNPSDRFVSALPETRFHYTRDLNGLGRLKKLYTKLFSKEIRFRFMKETLFAGLDVPTLCNRLLALNYGDQDFLLRNLRYPWLNPQSCFCGADVEVLHYESVADWQTLFDALGLSGLEDRLKIRASYQIDAGTTACLRKLYFEDEAIFDWYDKADHSLFTH